MNEPTLPTGALPDTAALDRVAAAEMLDVSPRTLDRLREAGDGPAWFRVGSQIRYELGALRAWTRQQMEDAS